MYMYSQNLQFLTQSLDIQNIEQLRSGLILYKFLPLMPDTCIDHFSTYKSISGFSDKITILGQHSLFKDYFNNLLLTNHNFYVIFFLSISGRIFFPNGTSRALVYKFYKYPDSYLNNLEVAQNRLLNNTHFSEYEKNQSVEILTILKKNAIFIKQQIDSLGIESNDFSTQLFSPESIISFDAYNSLIFLYSPLINVLKIVNT